MRADDNVHPRRATWSAAPLGGRPLPDTTEPAPDAPDVTVEECFMLSPTPQPIWPRVFPGL